MRLRPARVGAGALFAATVALALPVPAACQSVRVSGSTSLRLIELRPLVPDSVAVEDTRGEGILRRSATGELVRCVEGAAFCRFRRAGEVEAAVPLLQDVTVSAWGFGEGVRFYGRLRGRASLAEGAVTWPRADDRFDALVAYVEVDRERFRVRAGRQWRTSGLGFYNFDGASVTVRPTPALSFEAFGGRSLLRGLSEARTGDALAAVEPFAPDESGILVGGGVRWRPGPGLGVSAVYQRDVRSDRKGLYAERAALEGVWRRERLSADAELEVDLTTRTLNDGRLALRGRVSDQVDVHLFGRHYQPFFEAWTIWGAFQPVGFDEAGVGATWRPGTRRASLRVDGSWRSYDGAGASTTFGGARTSGWRLGLSGAVSPAPDWSLQGSVGSEVVPGAAVSDGSVRAAWTPAPRLFAGLTALAFQREYEFRVNRGTVWGLAADGGYPLGERTAVSGSLAVYRHRDREEESAPDWSQVRAALRVRWTVGPEPGTAGRDGEGR